MKTRFRIFGVFLATGLVGCSTEQKAENVNLSSARSSCENLEGVYEMEKDSCVGYYSTLLPVVGNAFGWLTLSAGDRIRVNQASCQSVEVSQENDASKSVKMEIGEKYSGIKNYKGSASRDLNGHFVFKDSSFDWTSGSNRTFQFQLDAEKSLVVKLDGSSYAVPFPKTDLKSVCTLKRVD
jgi:hypothetical protein